MTALPLAPNCLRIRILGKNASGNLAHIMHAQYSGGTPSVADVTAYANAFRSNWNTQFAPMVGNAVVYTGFEVADLGSLTGAVFTNTNQVTGTRAVTTYAPISACCVISWKIGLRFRGGHCRTYLPLSSAADYTAGVTINGAFVSSLTTAANSFLTSMNAVTSGTLSFALAMVSYWHANTLRPTGVPYLITAANVHGRIDTQRRRLGKEFG